MKQTLLLIVLIFMVVIPCAAQRKSQKYVSDPKAQKVAEVEYTSNTHLDMGIAGFVNRLRKQPSAKVYLIVYANPIIREYADALIRNTKWKFQERKIAQKRLVIIEGGFREITVGEFYIVPKGAVPPVPTPSSNEKSNTSKH